MSIPDVESFALSTSTRDKYGKVTNVEDITYWGIIERQTQFRGGVAQLVIGEGVVFSSNIQGYAVTGQEIVIDGQIFTITQVLELKDLEGLFHHTELVYG
jgi:hypothetical protein